MAEHRSLDLAGGALTLLLVALGREALAPELLLSTLLVVAGIALTMRR